MKRLIAVTLATFTTIGLLSGCAQDNTEDVSRISELEAQVGSLEDSMSALESEKEELDSRLSGAESEIDSLTEENERLTDELSEADSKNETLQTELEETASDFKKIRDVYCISFRERVLLSYDENRPDYKYWKLTLIQDDGSAIDIHSDYNISAFASSPDCSKFAFSNFEIEGTANGYWYDRETGKTTEISKEGLGTNYGPADFLWLDNRYFLFLSRFDHGTISQGGDVYVYDTENDTYRLLLKGGSMVEILSFEFSSYALYHLDTVFFRAVVFDKTANYTTQKSFTVSIEKLKEMIVDGEAMTYDGEMLSSLD